MVVSSEFNTAHTSLEDSLGGPPEMRAHEAALWKRQVLELVGSGALRPDARILDFGSGSGQWSLLLAETLPRATVVGVDVADRAVAAADARARARHLDNVRFVHYDGRVLPQLGEPFDCIVIFGVLLYLERERQVEEMLAQLDARLAPGGLLCVMELFPRHGREGSSFKTLKRAALLDFWRRRGYQLRSESSVYFSKAARYWLQASAGALRPLRPLWRALLLADRVVDYLLLRKLGLRVGERRFLVWRKPA